MIIASGKKDGRRLMVTYNGARFLFDGKENKSLLYQLLNELTELHPVGGTYHPEEELDPFNIINVLSEFFFDDNNVLLTTDENYELPYEEGLIY